jgi:hypothetical protein
VDATSENLRRALRLEAWTLAWMAVEAAASLGTGIAARSLLLIAFGADSSIELLSAGVLFHRLRSEYRGQHVGGEILEARERRASRIAGWLLYVLAAYVVAQAVWGLAHRQQADISPAGIAIAVVAALGMPLLARAKLRVANRIGSPALRADAMETITSGYMSWVLLGGLAANALVQCWWLDSAVSLLIVPILLREAHEAATGNCDCRHEKANVK